MAPSPDVLSNADITFWPSEYGDFTLWRTLDGASLLYPAPGTTSVDIRIDGTTYSTASADGIPISQPLHVDQNQGVATIEYLMPQRVRILHTFYLAGPAVRFRMTVTNEDGSAHAVAIRYLFDTQMVENDGAPISAQGVVDSQGSTVLTYETDVSPIRFAEWKDYDIWPDPFLTGVGTIETVPSRVVFGWWPSAYGSSFDYQPDPAQRFYTPGYTNTPESDSCVLMYFDLGSLTGGASSTVTTAYGLGPPSGSTGESARDRLIQAMRNLRSALSTYQQECIHVVALADSRLIQDIGLRQGFPEMAQEFAQDLMAEGKLAAIAGALLTDPTDAVAKEWINQQIAAISSKKDVETASWMVRHAADWFGNGPDRLDLSAATATIAAAIEAYQTREMAGITGKPDQVLDQAIQSLPDQIPDAVADVAVPILRGVQTRFLQVMPTEGRAAQEVAWCIFPSDSCFSRFDNLNPLLLGISSSVAERLRSASTLINVEGTSMVVRQSCPSTWVRGAAAVCGFSDLTIVGAQPAGTLDWRAEGIGDAPGAIATPVAVSAEPYALWEHFLGMNSLHSDLAMTGDLFERILLAVGDLVVSPQSASTGLTAGDLVIPTVNVDSSVAAAVVSASLDVANAGGGVAVGRGLLLILRMGSSTYDELICVAANSAGEVSVSPGGTTIAFDPRVPTGGLLWPGRYLAKATIVTNVGVATRSAYFQVCRGAACRQDDTWQVIGTGTILAGESVDVASHVPSEAVAVDYMLLHQGGDLDLHLYDCEERHVGISYQTGAIENQVLASYYSGPTAINETIKVLRCSGADYRLRVVGVTTSGAEEYRLLQSNLMSQPPMLAVSAPELSAAGRRGQSARFRVQLREVGEQQSLTGLAVTCSDLIGPDSRTVSRSTLVVGLPRKTLAAGMTMDVTIDVSLEADLPLGAYRGTVAIASSGGNQTLEATLSVIEPRRLTVAVLGDGQVDPPEGIRFFNEGQTISLTATPSQGAYVSAWYGADEVAADNLTARVLMRADKTVTVHFLPDECPDNPDKSTPGDCGCDAPDIDTDADGVADCRDKCPDTPAGLEVEANGCLPGQVDTDGDGVFDRDDECPRTPADESTDAKGCSCSQLDDDGDLTSNCLDLCPNTSAAEPPDANGCACSQRDEDEDGVNSCDDRCPQTPAGQPVDAEGCSDSQLDDDGDGVVNTLDQCPDSPSNQAADDRGCTCGQRDGDTDGVNDCVDGCPQTPAGRQVSTDGCPMNPDTHADDTDDGTTDDTDDQETPYIAPVGPCASGVGTAQLSAVWLLCLAGLIGLRTRTDRAITR